MSLVHEQLPVCVTAHPRTRMVALKPLPGRGQSASTNKLRQEPRQLLCGRRADHHWRDAEIGKPGSAVLKSVAAQPYASTATPFCAFEAGNLDLPSVRTDYPYIGLRGGGSRK
jgi:hypothetical protein